MNAVYIIGIMLVIYAIRIIINRVFDNRLRHIGNDVEIIRGEVIDLNGFAGKDWLFKLKDEKNNTHLIMNSAYYDERDLKFPITGQHLDVFLPGVLVNIASENIDGNNVVVKVFGFLANPSNKL